MTLGEYLTEYINGRLDTEFQEVERNRGNKSYGNKCLHQGQISAFQEVLDEINEFDEDIVDEWLEE